MKLYEERVSGERAYEGIIVNINRDKVRLEDGSITNREVVEHPGGVAVFAMDEEDNVFLVRQYRYPVGEVTLELPAGKLEVGEDPREGAIRELVEETGLEPQVFESMGCSYSSPGIISERIHLFFAKDLKKGESRPDPGEFLELVRVPYRELLDMVRRGEVHDSKTLAGILKASLILEAKKD